MPETADMEASEKTIQTKINHSGEEKGARDDGLVNTAEAELKILPPELQGSEAVADLFETLATQEQQPISPKKPVAVVNSK